MKLTKHDQGVIDGMKKRLEEMTGSKATITFLDTTKTINDHICQISQDKTGHCIICGRNYLK